MTYTRDEMEAAAKSWDAYNHSDASAAAAMIRQVLAENALWQKNSRATFGAMCAMRNDLNELFPMPSLESDLLQGPEDSVFCAEVVKAVKAHIDRLQARLDAGRDEIRAAYIQGAVDVHYNYQADAAAEFGEAADDYTANRMVIAALPSVGENKVKKGE
jgi:hypothetical protein